jgi:hypothetical protein
VSELPVGLGLWATAALLVLVYVGLFLLARQPVSLRPFRLAILLGFFVLLRLVLLWAEWPSRPEWCLILLMVVLCGCFLGLHSYWLMRITNEEMRQQVQTACRGLFLTLEEPHPGCLVLRARTEHRLRLASLGRRLQLFVRCAHPGTGKVGLFLDWIAKQNPGPVPRVSITLKGGPS